jgi:alanine-synthesizing transaminase
LTLSPQTFEAVTRPVKKIKRSNKLKGVCYDIRGPVLDQAKRLEDEGHKILKLNIGNPAPFGFDAPDDILKDVIHNLPMAQGYGPSNGLYSAKIAIQQYYQTLGLRNTLVDDIYIGNGVSELIVMAMQALLNEGDEVLIPSPDYPLWTAAVNLSGGKPVHYVCDESNGWQPDIDDIKTKITKKTCAIVIINPNNPTGAVYSKQTLEAITAVARENDLVIYSDEIYDKILYDQAVHIPIAGLSSDVFCVTFSGLSKNYRVAGFRAGWMLLTGPKHQAEDYINGLNMLSSMRLCANVPSQHAIQTALGGYQSINDLTKSDGRLYKQMELAYQMLNDIPGVSCTRPQGALYLFPKIDTNKFNIHNDETFILDFLTTKHVLLVHGTAFNWKQPNHFRIVFLPHLEELKAAILALGEFLDGYQQR